MTIERCGSWEVLQCNFGFFRLDGGAMFGSVPKNLWSKRIAPDDENCIRLATRSLVLKGHGKVVLVDTGMGEKWQEKSRKIFAIENTPAAELSIRREQVTDLILTHLHFDHAGGLSEIEGKELRPCYPASTVYLQRANLENAKNPTMKERASYLRENYGVLDRMTVNLVDGTQEILPGVVVHRVDGHTRGQQWIEVKGSPSIFYPTDLVPTSHHLSIPFHMGYDNCAETILGEKESFVRRAVDEEAIVFFQHDPEIAAATVMLDERGTCVVRDRFEVRT